MTFLATPASARALLFRPASERFHSRLGWLDSWHSFSFAEHYDPTWMGFGPLRVINDDTIAAGRGFGLHPHRDMEIITVMVEGQLNHRDSMGHSEVLRAGEVQCMSAGTGIVHSEINGGERPCRLLQIWIEPSSRGIAPGYEQKPFAIGAGWTPLLDPERRDGALAIHRPVRLWRAQPDAGASLSLVIGAGGLGWLQLISGSGRADGQALQQGDGLGFAAGGVDRFIAGPGGADLLLFELR
jgi:hypothetical protein